MSYDTRLGADLRQLMTLRQHYYPEGGWGWFVLTIAITVQCISHGLHMSIGVLITIIISTYHQNLLYAGELIYSRWFIRHVLIRQLGSFCTGAGMIGSMSVGTGLLFSPVAIAFCRRKSTRLLAVIGGLVTSLGCLFSSFALQFHQLFFSYGMKQKISHDNT